MCVRYRATGPDQNYSVPSFETSEVSGELIAQIAAPVGENNCFKGLISSYSGPCENSELELLRIVRKSSHARLAWPATKRCPDEKLYKIPRLFAWSSLLPTAQLTDLLLWSPPLPSQHSPLRKPRTNETKENVKPGDEENTIPKECDSSISIHEPFEDTSACRTRRALHTLVWHIESRSSSCFDILIIWQQVLFWL